MELSNVFVCLMGVGTVFFGLVCIILLCTLMSNICARFTKPDTVPITSISPTFNQAHTTIINRQEFIAAVSAVIAEELGTDVSAIRILSVKEL